MIELLLGILGICITVSVVAGIERIWVALVTYPGKHTSRQVRHREEIKRKRAARYASIRHENDWRNAA